jgi:hypothetical protein
MELKLSAKRVVLNGHEVSYEPKTFAVMLKAAIMRKAA